jgi:hypothetical protein
MARTGSTTASRPGRVLALAVVVALASATAATAAPKDKTGSSPKHYAATASPAVVAFPIDGSSRVEVRLLNCGSGDCGRSVSQQSFGSAEVTVPVGVGFDLGDVTTAVATDDSTTPVGWSATDLGGGVLRLAAGSAPAVQPGSTLVVSIDVDAPATPGRHEIQTQVKQSNDFSGLPGNSFARVGDDPSVFFGHGSAVGLAWVQQPSSLQADPPVVTTSGVTGVTRMCPAPSVRVVDALGNTVTSSTAVVTLAPVDGGKPGLGGTTATAVSGIATFGDAACTTGVSASNLGAGYRLVASSPGLADSDASSPFSVLAVYGACGATCATGNLTGAQKTVASVSATGGTGDPDRLTFSFDDDWPFLGQCDPDPAAAGTNPYRDPLTVDLADHDKTVELRWTKAAVRWATNNGASQWQVCVAAQAPFTAVLLDGSVGQATCVTLTGDPTGPTAPCPAAPPAPADAWYVGALLPCGDSRVLDPATGAPAGPCLQRLGRSAGEQIATVFLPDAPGDPRMG